MQAASTTPLAAPPPSPPLPYQSTLPPPPFMPLQVELRDTWCYNATIGAAAKLGDLPMALSLLEQMKAEGVCHPPLSLPPLHEPHHRSPSNLVPLLLPPPPPPDRQSIQDLATPPPCCRRAFSAHLD